MLGVRAQQLSASQGEPERCSKQAVISVLRSEWAPYVLRMSVQHWGGGVRCAMVRIRLIHSSTRAGARALRIQESMSLWRKILCRKRLVG